MKRDERIKKTIEDLKNGVIIAGHNLKMVPGLYRSWNLVLEDKKICIVYSVKEDTVEYDLKRGLVYGNYELIDDSESEQCFVYDVQKGRLRNEMHMKMLHHCGYSFPTALSGCNIMIYDQEKKGWITVNVLKRDHFIKMRREGVVCFSNPNRTLIEYPQLLDKKYNFCQAYNKEAAKFLWNAMLIYMMSITVCGYGFERFTLCDIDESISIKTIELYPEKQPDWDEYIDQKYSVLVELAQILRDCGFSQNERITKTLYGLFSINQRVFTRGREIGFPNSFFNTLFRRCIREYLSQNTKEDCLKALRNNPDVLFEKYLNSEDQITESLEQAKRRCFDTGNMSTKSEKVVCRLCYDTRLRKYSIKGESRLNNASLNDGYLRNPLDLMELEEEDGVLFADLAYDIVRGKYVVNKNNSTMKTPLIYLGLRRKMNLGKRDVLLIDTYSRSNYFAGSEMIKTEDVGAEQTIEKTESYGNVYLGYAVRLPDNRLSYNRMFLTSGKQEKDMFVPVIKANVEYDYRICFSTRDRCTVIQSQNVNLGELNIILKNFEIKKWCWEEKRDEKQTCMEN